MPNYEDFKRYGEMEKQKRSEPPTPPPDPVKKPGKLRLFGRKSKPKQ